MPVVPNYNTSWSIPELATRLDWIAAARLPSLLGRPQTERPPELTAVEVNLLILAARNFERSRAARPYLNACVVAMEAAAKAYDISHTLLFRADREPSLVEVRYKMMAFVSVVTHANTRQIGRVFHRDHSSVTAASAKYAHAIRTAITALTKAE
jgi:hypothetical protein